MEQFNNQQNRPNYPPRQPSKLNEALKNFARKDKFRFWQNCLTALNSPKNMQQVKYLQNFKMPL